MNPKCYEDMRSATTAAVTSPAVAKDGANQSQSPSESADEKSENGGDNTDKPLSQDEQPNTVLNDPQCSMWFIGLEFQRTENLNVDLTDSIQQFTNSVHSHAVSIKLLKDGMEIEARHLRRKQLPQYIDKETLNRERKIHEASAASASSNRKRISVDTSQSNDATQPAKLVKSAEETEST